jgi:HD-like signal output (HDOD) protein/CheY-like chemotaxis protein
MAGEQSGPTGKPKAIIVDRKFKPEDLKIPRNQVYVKDLGQCFKIFQKWDYDIIWVESGVDCLRAVKRWSSDIKSVLVEAYIAGGGFTVARLIRFKPDCKHIPVFLMSNQLTENDLKEGDKIGIADCLVRPFNNPDDIESRMQTVLTKLEEESGEQAAPVDPKAHILAELEKITNLPAMPTVYNEIDKLSKNPDTTTEEYAGVIELDPGITTQMLRLCNSSAFSFSWQITSVQDAVNLLGLQTVIDFVRTLSVVGAFKGKAQAFNAGDFWKHSIAVGVIAKLLHDRKEISSKIDTGEDDPFMAGMVHDIGKQVLGHFFNEMYQMVLDEMKGGSTMYDVELDVLGITHANIGAGLAQKWQLPGMLGAVIGSHHEPTSDDANPMTQLIHISDAFSKVTGFAFGEKIDTIQVDEALLESIELPPEVLEELKTELDSTIRTQVNDTFSAIFK